jgi:hypothetical protein
VNDVLTLCSLAARGSREGRASSVSRRGDASRPSEALRGAASSGITSGNSSGVPEVVNPRKPPEGKPRGVRRVVVSSPRASRRRAPTERPRRRKRWTS